MYVVVWLTLFGAGLVVVTLPTLLYPTLLAVLAARRRRCRGGGTCESPPGQSMPTVSVITVTHNGAALIRSKIANTMGLDYPADKLEMILCSDGSTDGTDAIAEECRRTDQRLRCLALPRHSGKACGLNAAAAAATGDVLVFSDTDALLAANALRHLLVQYSDADVGGACGQRAIRTSRGEAFAGQSGYIRLDSRLKRWESTVGSITSNDGKLYWMRRELFTTVPDGVADDLFNCLEVVRQGRRFAFAPDAVACVPPPSRDAAHELERRRRIVCGSLLALWTNRVLFNPFTFGAYGPRLAINKILRRMLPLGLVLLLISSLALVHYHGPVFGAAAALQAAFYGLAVLSPAMTGRRRIPARIRRLAAACFYACVGNAGMLLGICDFVRGRRCVTWTPRKLDS